MVDSTMHGIPQIVFFKWCLYCVWSLVLIVNVMQNMWISGKLIQQAKKEYNSKP